MSSRLPNNVKTWVIVSITGAALITAGAASAAGFRPTRAPAPAGGGAVAAPARGGKAAVPAGGGAVAAPPGGGAVAAPAGGGKVRPVPAPAGVAPAAPAAIGGGAGAVNALMVPTVPLTAVGGANENPTAPGAATAAVGSLRITANRGLAATITNMDPARFPIGCSAAFTMNGVISGFPIVSAVAPATGTSVGAHGTPAAPGTNHVTLDIVCGAHQTHWIGTI